MESIRVNKKDLLETIRQNRDKHREIFLAAQDRYRAKIIDLLEERLQEARDGKQINRMISLPEPEDHTEDFDTAIEMLGWEVGDEVDLTWSEFQQYVKNQWSWSRMWAANTASYVQQ